MLASSRPARAPQSNGVCAVIRAEARVGADEELADLLDDLAESVLADEPGCVSYVVTRMIGSREHFAVHARFSSWDAFNAHAETRHLSIAMPRLAALLATSISMELFVEQIPLRRPVGIGYAGREIEPKRHRE